MRSAKLFLFFIRTRTRTTRRKRVQNMAILARALWRTNNFARNGIQGSSKIPMKRSKSLLSSGMDSWTPLYHLYEHSRGHIIRQYQKHSILLCFFDPMLVLYSPAQLNWFEFLLNFLKTIISYFFFVIRKRKCEPITVKYIYPFSDKC